MHPEMCSCGFVVRRKLALKVGVAIRPSGAGTRLIVCVCVYGGGQGVPTTLSPVPFQRVHVALPA